MTNIPNLLRDLNHDKLVSYFQIAILGGESFLLYIILTWEPRLEKQNALIPSSNDAPEKFHSNVVFSLKFKIVHHLTV